MVITMESRNERRQTLTLLVRNFENQSLLKAFATYCQERMMIFQVVHLVNEQSEATYKIQGDYIISTFVSDIIAYRAKALHKYYACVEDVMKHYEAAKGLGETLCNESHLTIRYLGSDTQKATYHMEGLKEAYKKIHQPHDYAIMMSDGTYVNAYEKAQELFSQPVDLLIAQDALHAQAIYQYCQDYHIIIPQHVSIVFFGSKEEAQRFSPLLTGITYRYDMIVKHVMKEKANRPRFAYLEGSSIQ